jgi:protocatechuate 3,4-dioxygenase beta subunit
MRSRVRARDARTAGGLAIVLIAVLVAAWLVGGGETDDPQRAEEAARRTADAHELAAAASGAAPADAERAPEALPAAVRTAPAAEGDATLPGETLVITGRVVDVQGRGLSQALVLHWPTAIHRAATGLDQSPRWYGVDWTKFVSTRTDADGRFTLATRDEPQERVHMLSAEGGALRVGGVDPGHARPRLLVERDGYATDVVPVNGAHGGLADAGDIVLQAGATLTGRAVDADGAPLARISIAVGGFAADRWYRGEDAELFELRTAQSSGPDGRIRIPGLPAGPLRLHAEPEGYAAVEQEATLAVGEVTDVGDLVFGAGGHLSGRVVDADGRPVPGAELLARYSIGLGVGGADQAAMVWSARVMFGDRMLDQTAVADAQGRFTLTGLLHEMSHVNLLARAPGFDPALEASVQAGTADLLLRLRPQASWRVAVTDAAGAPVPGAAVEAWRWDEAAEWSADCDVVPEGGTFVVRGAGLAATKLRASAPGHAARLESLPALKPGEIRETTVQLVPGCAIAGRVLRDDGQPLARAAVRLALDGYLPFERKIPGVSTDADGRFAFADVEPGAWTLRARATGCLPVLNPIPVEVRDATPIDVEIVLPRGGRIAGVLRDAAGAPVPGALVTAQTRDAATLAFAVAAGGGPAPAEPPRSLSDRAFTDRAGRFALLCLAPGAWELDGDDGATGHASVVVGETVEVELTRAAPPAPPQLRGRVLLAGQPLAGAVVELGDAWAFRFNDETEATATTGPDGVYELTASGAGKHQVRARDAVGPSAPQPVELEWGRVSFVDIELPGGRVAGRVVARGSGEPLADVRVQLALQGNPAAAALGADQRNTESGSDGGFTFERVPDGEYKLTAGGGYCVPPPPVTLQVHDGEPSEVTLETEIGGSVLVVLADPSLWLSMFVSLTPVHGDAAAVRARSGLDGMATLGPVTPGDYDLVILRKDDAAEHVVRRLGVTVVAGETLRVKEVEDG